jgi:hypothetical protein
MRIHKLFYLVLYLFLALICQSQEKPNEYLGQIPPDSTPKIFKLPVPEKFFAAERIAISDNGNEIYYQELDGYSELDGKPHTQRIKYYMYSDGKWNGPFTLFEGLGAPCLSMSGDTMFIQKTIKEAFFSVRNKNNWSEPTRFLSKFKITHYLQESRKGNFFMSSVPVNTFGGVDRSRVSISGTDTTISGLGKSLNSTGHDLDFFIARDESFFIITDSTNALSISFLKSDGTYTAFENLGKKINFGLAAWGPYVTKDNKYLFFTTGTKLDYSDAYIYWVKFDEILERLKHSK